jgi:acyl carrier protein
MAITMESFLEKLATLFEDTDVALITPDVEFKQLDEWDSLIALSLIALTDEEYQVRLTGDDIRSSKTVSDLFEKIKAKAS